MKNVYQGNIKKRIYAKIALISIKEVNKMKFSLHVDPQVVTTNRMV